MCDGQGSPAGVAGALAMPERALDHLNAADVASLPAATQAETLRALARAEAKQVAARARVLGAFAGQGGFEDDGHGSARSWVKWQTRVSHGAAVAAVGWARRLAAHPVIAGALAAGEVSPSWARHLCDWADRLPEAQRGDAGEILAGAARSGADLGGLAGLAQEMYQRCCRDSSASPPGDGFADRWFRLGVTFGGAGRAEGDLTPGCAAARASQPGWLTGPDAEAALCDATVVPVVTGHVDWAALDQLAETFLHAHTIGGHGSSGPGQPAGPGHQHNESRPAHRPRRHR